MTIATSHAFSPSFSRKVPLSMVTLARGKSLCVACVACVGGWVGGSVFRGSTRVRAISYTRRFLNSQSPLTLDSVPSSSSRVPGAQYPVLPTERRDRCPCVTAAELLLFLALPWR